MDTSREFIDGTEKQMPVADAWGVRLEPLFQEWVARCEPVFQKWATWYGGLTQEQLIWFWIAVALTAILILAGTYYVIYRTIRGLNTLLQSPEGWRPINFKSWMWIGSGFWLLTVAWQLHHEEVAGWTVAGAVGVLVILGFIWSMIYRFKLLRGIVAIIVNGIIGLIVAPLVIHLGLLIVFVILAGIALWIYSLFNPRRVVVYVD